MHNHHGQHGMQNAGHAGAAAFKKAGQRPGQTTGKPSFANELAQAAKDAGGARGQNPAQEQAQNQETVARQESFNHNKNASPMQQSGMTSGLSQGLNQKAQAEMKSMRDRESLKEKAKLSQDKESIKESEEFRERYASNENTKAHVAQDQQRQVTEAYREGGMSEDQMRQQYNDERKKQLANWEELAPRIIEDPKNLAVRIDLPGVMDIETVIVRMQNGQVSIQTVGEKDLMEKLQANESKLAKNLRGHNITLGGLQAFDAVMTNGMQQQAA